MITKGDTLLAVMAIMLVVAAKRARVLRGLVIRLPRLWLRYQVCYAGVNGHTCGVQMCVCLIPRGRAYPDTCLTYCVDCLGVGIIVVIPLVIAVVSLTLFTKMRLVRMEIFPFALRLICLLTWQRQREAPLPFGRLRYSHLVGSGFHSLLADKGWLNGVSLDMSLLRRRCGCKPVPSPQSKSSKC
ncbi:hypothetical protein ACFX2B_037606 [Malus domestica]